MSMYDVYYTKKNKDQFLKLNQNRQVLCNFEIA